jgi:hypothetical protein
MLLLYRIAFFLYFPSGLISRERAGKKKGNSNTVENKTSRRKKTKKWTEYLKEEEEQGIIVSIPTGNATKPNKRRRRE